LPARPTILFDGVCNLCNASVAWVIRRDPSARFAFAPLQSRVAAGILAAAGVPATSDSRPDSIVLVDASGVYTRSDAAIRIARALGFPWSLAAAFIVVPRPLRDAGYALVARNRYRWFGVRVGGACMAPTPELRSRFLDADERV